MKKSAPSVLLAAMLGTSGFALAQAPPSPPMTRAEVKSQATPIKAGTDGGAAPVPAIVPAPPSPPTARADVKAQAPPVKSGDDGGSGAAVAQKPAPGDKTRTRAEVKSEINVNAIKSGNMSGDALKAAGVSPPTTAAERKAKRAERKAAAKAKAEAKAMTKPGAGAAAVTEGKAQ